MSFLETVLEPPRYGFSDASGDLIKPTRRQIWSEFFYRLNIIRDRRNWLPLWGWLATCSLAIPCLIFLRYFFSLKLAAIGFIYSMVVLGTYGTIYFHRYSTHRAFQFRNRFWLWVTRNLVIKIVPEEVYVVSHHVHHRYSEKPGDPYNVHAGWLYCFLADVNHQLISRSLSESDYNKLVSMMAPTGMKTNTYLQYKKWGSLARPGWTVFHFLGNWAFWYATFYWIGGNALATAIFGLSVVWAFGIRTFNYDGHGRGKDLRRDGIDFNRRDLSINRVWPGYVASEWHNNHHLYPGSARCGFLRYQLDLAWLAIRSAHSVGIVTTYRNDYNEFLEKYVRGGALAAEVTDVVMAR